MTIIDFAAIIGVVVAVLVAAFFIVALNNLNNSLARLEQSSQLLTKEGMTAFKELRQLIADADAELDKVDLVLDRADQATTFMTETSRRTHEAVQDPVIKTLAVASGTSKVAKKLLSRKSKKDKVLDLSS